MRGLCRFTSLTLALLAVLPLVVAHGAEHGASMDMVHASMHDIATIANSSTPLHPGQATYYNHADHFGWMYAHIGLMTLAWAIILPVAVFISTAKSRLAIPIQLAFLVINGLGIFTSAVYDTKTPDLYLSNAHHKLGWATTFIALAWILLGILTHLSRRKKQSPIANGSHAMTSQTMARFEELHGYDRQHDHRWSRDSGHGTDQDSPSGSQRMHSTGSIAQKLEEPVGSTSDNNDSDGEDDDSSDGEGSPFLNTSPVDRFITRRIPRLQPGRLLSALEIVHIVLERCQVILAFLAICTGFVTWWGIFHGDGLLNGLAHWIKGGIFFWYGLLTLGRWMGAFSDYGWAWNAKPDYPIVSHAAARMPSAEFVESFVIFFYGSTNVFLEHLSAWGKPWSPMDLEHISITIMFFGGGLLGMLAESKKARRMLNSNVELVRDEVEKVAGSASLHSEEWESPRTYATSLNPLPALVIFLLGLMMSSHHQDSMVSTMVHKQWGTLFSGFALARLFTYLLMYLKPPTSYFPSRPPTELVSTFCLICGGLVFMASTRDVLKMIERNGLHAMFILAVMVGMSCLIMVWTVVLYGIRGWALRQEAKRVT